MSRSDRRRPRAATRRVPVGMLVASALVATAACVEPELVEEPPASDEALPEIAEAPPTDDSALRVQVERLSTALDGLDAALADAEAAADLGVAQAAGAVALGVLIGTDDPEDPDADASTAVGVTPPLLPSRTPDRAVDAQEATLIDAVTAARDAGGALGRELSSLLADAVAGDLGAWQRDPEGMIALARDTGDASRPIGDLEQAVLDLPGDATRTLAWVFVLVDADDVGISRQAAERARAHVGLMRAGLAELPLSAQGGSA
jgi:hypothetical protein